MIGYLAGKVIEVSTETAVVVVQGVGYEVTCSLGTLSELQALQGETAELWIQTQVREDAFQLFGFLRKIEKQMFNSLLKVNGVGPKSAINILSGASLDEITGMIENEDVKALSKLPKVGKKTAEQMILTLKGKLVVGETEGAGPQRGSAGAHRGLLSPAHRQLSSALVNLGFRANDVDQVVAQIPKDIDLESGLKTALAALTSI